MGKKVKRFFHDVLRLRTRNKNVGRHPKRQRVKFPFPDEVGNGLPAGPASDKLPETRPFLGFYRLVVPRVEFQTLGVEDGGKKQLRVKART